MGVTTEECLEAWARFAGSNICSKAESVHAVLRACEEAEAVSRLAPSEELRRGLLMNGKLSSVIAVCTMLTAGKAACGTAEAGRSLWMHLAALHACWEDDGACADPALLQKLLGSLLQLQQCRSVPAPDKAMASATLRRLLTTSLQQAKHSAEMLALLDIVSEHVLQCLPLLPEDAAALLQTVAAAEHPSGALLQPVESLIALGALRAARSGQVDAHDPQLLFRRSMRQLQDMQQTLALVRSGSEGRKNGSMPLAFPSQAALSSCAELAAALAATLAGSEEDEEDPVLDALAMLHGMAEVLLDLLEHVTEGHPVGLTLQNRLLGMLCALRPLQEAAGKSPRPVTLHTALALSQSLLPKVARVHTSKDPWLWDASVDLLPAAAAVGAEPCAVARVCVEGCARLIWRAWAGGWRADAESALAATLGSAFAAVDPAMANASAAQQQAALLVCARLAHLGGASDERLAHIVFPLLVSGDHARRPPPVSAAYVWAVAQFGAASAKAGSRWGYDRAAELLAELYRRPEQPLASNLLWAGAAPGSQGSEEGLRAAHAQSGSDSGATHGSRGVLPCALLLLAEAASQAVPEIRHDCHALLLSLFLQTALLAPAAKTGALLDMGALLKPLTAAALGAEPELTTTPPGKITGMLLVWMHVALHRLIPLSSSNGGSSRRALHEQQQVAAAGPLAEGWRDAAGVLAGQGTPHAVLAASRLGSAEVNAEVAVHLSRQGTKGSGPNLASLLMGLLRPSSALVVPASETEAAGQLLACAAANLARVRFGPLPGATEATRSPLEPVLSGLLARDPSGWQAKVLSAIAEATFNAYCDRLQEGTAARGDSEPDRAAAVEGLAVGLVSIASATGSHAHVQALAGGLVDRLLYSFPGLKWSPALLAVLYNSLDDGVEEDAAALDDGRSATAQSGSLQRLKWVLHTGAEEAPGHTEALLQELLGSSQGAPLAPNLAMQLTSALQAGRGAFPLAALPHGHSSRLTATRKAHFTGLVSGLLAGGLAQEPDLAPAAAAAQLQARTAEALQEAAAQAESGTFSDSLLKAAAVLSATAHEALGSARIGLLRAVAGACLGPKGNMHRERMALCVTAWHWIAAAAPSLQVALLSEVVAAWNCSVGARKGMFDASFDAEAFRNSTGTGGDYGALSEGVACHHLWIGYLTEAWQVASQRVGPDGRAELALLEGLLQRALSDDLALTQHPSAPGARFRLLLLAMQHASHQRVALLYERVLAAALSWFSGPVAYFGGWSPTEAREQAAAVQQFAEAVSQVQGWPSVQLSSSSQSQVPPIQAWLALLAVLLEHERERLHTWAWPLEPEKHRVSMAASAWQGHARTAWALQPALALNLLDRFPKAAPLRRELAALVADHCHIAAIQSLPAAAALLASTHGGGAAKPGSAGLAALQNWAPAPLLQALVMLGGPTGGVPAVRGYALRSLRTCVPEQVAFFLPQLVQQLRGDDGDLIRHFLLEGARASRLFAHRLVCTLASEARPPAEAFSPAVKRSGWKPPRDTGLWDTADAVKDQVFEEMPGDDLAFLRAELALFDAVTGISGALYKVPKEERKAAAVREAKKIALPRDDLYLPTSPELRVLGMLPESATPMQSAAKVPILVAFQVEKVDEAGGHAPQQADALGEEQVVARARERVAACIFKVGDDCRQDLLALQVVALLRDALARSSLPLYLAPYGVLPTAYECGIIEVVPNTNSRGGLGETADGGLYDIFCREFGTPGTPRFEAARRNFIVSEAGYAIACYLLQAKDRHNGNILVDTAGHLVHIDFGFILEISPGGNMRFESAAFKLSHEMTMLIDPGGGRTSPHFRTFEDLVVRGYLAARGCAESIIATVALMADSGLPCFGRGRPLENLRARFHLEMSDAQAAAFMRATVVDAYDKWTTGFYDYVQYLQNSIPK